MSAAAGSSEIAGAALGEVPVSALAVGDVVVWEAPVPEAEEE